MGKLLESLILVLSTWFGFSRKEKKDKPKDKSTNERLSPVEQDQAEAPQLYRIAAEQGIPGAQYQLGVMYAEGRGVAQDDMESVRWFRLAAEQGDAEAQAGLGLAYGTGRGVVRDFVAAYMWTTLSVEQLTGATLNGALKFRNTITAAMTPEQLMDAQQRAREFIKEKPTQ